MENCNSNSNNTNMATTTNGFSIKNKGTGQIIPPIFMLDRVVKVRKHTGNKRKKRLNKSRELLVANRGHLETELGITTDD